MINKTQIKKVRRGPSRPWRKDLRRQIAHLILLQTNMPKADMLVSVKQQLNTKWTSEANRVEIEKITQRKLLDCVKSVAYDWLKQLQANPPKDTTWYPDNAVHVAYQIFRFKDLNSRFPTLCKYLNNKSRISELKSIRIPRSGYYTACFHL